jgi:hypothetical protein
VCPKVNLSQLGERAQVVEAGIGHLRVLRIKYRVFQEAQLIQHGIWVIAVP